MKKKLMITVDEWVYKALREDHINISSLINDSLIKHIMDKKGLDDGRKKTKR